MGDSAGAVLGPLLAAALIGVLGFRWLFAVSVLPAIGAALAILLLVREGPRVHREVRERSGGRMRDLALSPSSFRSLVAGTGLFGLGNFSATLLILYATNVLVRQGRSTAGAASIAILLYAAHNAANSVAAYPAGVVADRIGRRMVLVGGILLFALACFGFAAGPRAIGLLAALFVAVGASTGMVETAQGSHASELLADEVRGRGFGVLGLVDGLGDLVSSIVVGVLFTFAAPAWGFLYGGALAVAGAAVLAAGVSAPERS